MEKTLLERPENPQRLENAPRSGPSGQLILRRKCACGASGGGCPACEDESKDKLRRASLGPIASGRAPAIVNEVLGSTGRTLDQATRAFMEPRLGRNFGDVRVHTGSRAADSARAVSALAYTVGKDVVFGDGKYAPETREGKSLLAHELTHVAQNGGAAPDASTPISIGPEGDAYETQADQAANTIAAGGQQGPRLISAMHQGQPGRLSRAQFTVGNATVNIDYGNLTALKTADYQSAIETNYASFSGGQAADIHSEVAALTDRGREWVLYALDLLVDNPVTGLDKVQAVKRLIGYAPGAKFWAAGSSDGGVANANEALSVAGWFEKALTSGLSALSSVRQSFVQQRLNPNTSSSGGSACPSPRPASEQLDSAKLKSNMPTELEAYLRKVVVPTNVKTQSMTPLLKVADAVQARARSFYSPYADHSRGSGNTLVQQWQYSSHLVSSQSSAGTPTTDLRLAYLDSRARKVGDQGLFATVHFDARCDADETVLDEIVHTMEPQSTIRALVDPILRQKSYTEQTATPKQVVLNPQVDVQTDECKARWETIRTLCHELMHVMTHDDFRRAEKGRQIMTEGFPEVLGHYLYLNISADAGLKKTMEDGLASAPCKDVPGSKIEYDPGGPKAEEIRIAVKDDHFRAAFFLGQLSLAGIQPKLIDGVDTNDPLEAEAERAAEGVSKSGAIHATTARAPAAIDAGLPDVGAGRPLEPDARRYMETRFGHNFSHVRVHTDSAAGESARGIGALAYTMGNHLVFGAGQYSPQTIEGRRLLAHELTHVVQHQRTPGAPTLRKKDDPKGKPVKTTKPKDQPEKKLRPKGQHAGEQLLTEEKQLIAQRLKNESMDPGSLGTTGLGPRFLLHDTSSEVSLASMKHQKDIGRGFLGKGVSAYVPRAGAPVIARPDFYETLRPTTTEFEKATKSFEKPEDMKLKTPEQKLEAWMQRRDELLRQVWAGMTEDERKEAKKNAAVDVDVSELATELKGDDEGQRTAKGKDFKAPFEDQMKSGSKERIWTLGVWAVADFCARHGSTAAEEAGKEKKQETPDAGTPVQGPSPKERSEARKACARLAPFFRELQTRTSSFVTVEIVQPGVISKEEKQRRAEDQAKKEAEEGKKKAEAAKKKEQAEKGTAGASKPEADKPKEKQPAPKPIKVSVNENTCNPDNPDIIPLKNPPYSETQYESITSLYLRAANFAGSFPAVTTHFDVDAFIGGHCDPRCFDLNHLYNRIAAAVHHDSGSTYGIKPSYGRVSGKNNVWWDETKNDRCHGKPPSSG